MKIAVDGWTMPPFMGLASWAAFTPGHDGADAMVMGDTVLFEDEVNPVMSAALDAGLEVTALHNHFFFDEPKVYFMHIGGMGDAGNARRRREEGLRQDRRDPRGATRRRSKASPARSVPPSSITAAPLEAVLGVKGQASDGMFKVVIGRPAAMHGVSVGKEMGVNTWAAFAGTDDEAVVDGDFAMTESELQTGAARRCARKASTSSPSTST